MRWRVRAEEARRVADQLSDPQAKAMMLRIADDYDRIADHAQHRALSGAKR
jgi:hypothetical protein